MNLDLVARLLAGAQTGSLALTRSEAIELIKTTTPHASVIIDGNPVEIHTLPWHVLPDTPDQLPQLDPWRAQAHENLVDGLIDGDDQRRLFDVADRREAEHRREAAELVEHFTLTPNALAEIRTLLDDLGAGDA